MNKAAMVLTTADVHSMNLRMLGVGTTTQKIGNVLDLLNEHGEQVISAGLMQRHGEAWKAEWARRSEVRNGR